MGVRHWGSDSDLYSSSVRELVIGHGRLFARDEALDGCPRASAIVMEAHVDVRVRQCQVTSPWSSRPVDRFGLSVVFGSYDFSMARTEPSGSIAAMLR